MARLALWKCSLIVKFNIDNLFVDTGVLKMEDSNLESSAVPLYLQTIALASALSNHEV